MSKRSVLPMESYRLAQYAVQVPCYICEGGNSFDAELCRHCCAPMALAHQANTQKVHPKMVAIVGSSGSGKTVYLGMLTDMLSRQSDRMQMLARGAFSITLQQATVGALVRSEFPEKTPNEADRWCWMHCQVQSPRFKKPIELIVPDVAGEAILHEIDHPRSYPALRSFFSKCCGAMVLLDAPQLETSEQSQDFFAMKILSYLCELDGDKKKGWPSRPVAFVLTKADQCEESFNDPAHYAQTHSSGLWRLSQERLTRRRFFASGVAGACAYRSELGGRVQVPLRIEPRGIIEPFEWLIDQVVR